MADFLTDRCVLGGDLRESFTALYNAFVALVQESGRGADEPEGVCGESGGEGFPGMANIVGAVPEGPEAVGGTEEGDPPGRTREISRPE